MLSKTWASAEMIDFVVSSCLLNPVYVFFVNVVDPGNGPSVRRLESRRNHILRKFGPIVSVLGTYNGVLLASPRVPFRIPFLPYGCVLCVGLCIFIGCSCGFLV